MQTRESSALSDHPLAGLAREDLDLIMELVLHSGSLKELAESFGVTYPTIRLRLDRVIERLRARIDGRVPDPLSEVLARLIERGEISASAARIVRDTVRKTHQGDHP